MTWARKPVKRAAEAERTGLAAFERDALLALGGFDVQFRQAGDDVDICWRFLDAGMNIGYAPSALASRTVVQTGHRALESGSLLLGC